MIKKIIFQLKSQRLLNNRTLVLITNSGGLRYLGHKNIVRCKPVYAYTDDKCDWVLLQIDPHFDHIFSKVFEPDGPNFVGATSE